MAMQAQQYLQFECRNGVQVRRTAVPQHYSTASDELAHALNSHRGVLLASNFEYPGRYTRWDIGFINPPIVMEVVRERFVVTALNTRGEIMLPELLRLLESCDAVADLSAGERSVSVSVRTEKFVGAEEMRSRRPSVFSLLRAVTSGFHTTQDDYLGLYGSLGYDLTFQFEDVRRFQQREDDQRDLVLYLPDQITVTDHRSEQSICYSYEFNCRTRGGNKLSETTGGFKRSGESSPYVPAIRVDRDSDHEPGEFADRVRHASDFFRRGDLFEVVPGQTFYSACKDSPADVFQRLKTANPAPYGALMNLGKQEYLVAASPEMFVRVDGREIETCPISGTIKRGEDAIADAAQIKTLLNSEKDESELSMCTDVDRNDKARICVPGSVKVVGRRQIEMYSRLIHTVDHVKGQLQPEFDALDGFFAHTWAVTVTGAPKLAAMQYLEEHEKSPRHWYGGAIGHIGFNGNLNTGLTLRTVRINQGVAEVRAGATLLIDSDPVEEEKETQLKASALRDAVSGYTKPDSTDNADGLPRDSLGAGLTALMVDHQDSFVHNLGAYFRELGVGLITLRPEAARRYLRENSVSFVILSPGPSAPADFQMSETIALALGLDLPIFGVCLGLQGLVEYFGGSLNTMAYPMHGKASPIAHDGCSLFSGIEDEFSAGRYHSLIAETLPECLRAVAKSAAGEVMAIEHIERPIWAVQFHPESIMSLQDRAGHRLIENVVAAIADLKPAPRLKRQVS